MLRRSSAVLLFIFMLACAGSLHATEESNYLQRLLNGAKPGQTVTLPAGEFRGGVSMPAGVEPERRRL